MPDIDEDITKYEDFLIFCEQWNIKPRDEDENWEQQYQDNVHYMMTGEGYPTGIQQ